MDWAKTVLGTGLFMIFTGIPTFVVAEYFPEHPLLGVIGLGATVAGLLLVTPSHVVIANAEDESYYSRPTPPIIRTPMGIVEM